MDMMIFVIALLAFAGITLAKGMRIVPQGEEWIVERLGKYHGTLLPGLNIIIPYLDKIAYKLVTKDIILDVQEQEVITRDNAVIVTNAIAFIKVTDPIKAVYGVTDFSEAIRNMIMTTLRSIVGEMQLDEALSNRDTHQGAAARSHRRRGDRLGPDGEVGRDPGHQALALDAEGDGNAGRRRAGAQGDGDALRRREAVDDPAGRSAARIGAARCRSASDAGRGERRGDQTRRRRDRSGRESDALHAWREIHHGDDASWRSRRMPRRS